MKALTGIIVAVSIVSLGFPALVEAHSTKGRIKIPLVKDALTIDDVAYFMESYVHHELYRDPSGKNIERRYVKEFKKVEQEGNQAHVSFIVLDVKNNSNFPDRMTLEQADNGVWYYRPAGKGEPVEVFTFVLKWNYYYQTYLLPALAVGVCLAVAFLIGLRFRRRKKKGAEV